MGGSSKPSSPIYSTVREERKVLRYELEEGVKVNERARLALQAISSQFRSERPRGLVPGSIAHAMGDGNGWSAMPTLRMLLKREWVREDWTAGMDHQIGYLPTDAGMAALFALDEQHREREACRTCGGKSRARSSYEMYLDRPWRDDSPLCLDCEGTLLVRRAPVGR